MNRYAWRPACNGTSRFQWFACRERRADDPDRGPKGSTEYQWTPTGRVRRYATREAAQKVADQLNAIDWQPFNMCGVQTVLPNGETVTCDGWENGARTEGGFALTYRYDRFNFSTRADAYAAVELLAAELRH